MTSPAGCATDLLAAIADLSRAVEVACGGWERLSRDQREDAYLELERARKKLAIVDAQYVQARNEDLWCSDARLPASLAKRQRISKAEARRRRAVVRRLQPDYQRLGVKGNEGFMPCVRDKVAAGVVGADAVEKIDRVLRSFPAHVHAELTAAADPHIAELVEHVDVDDLDALAPMLRALLGIDDPYTDADRQRARGVRVGAQGHDGMSRISGRLTPHLAALVKRLSADHAGPGDLLADGVVDDRDPAQRLHDAVEAALAAGFGRDVGPAGDGWGPGEPDPDIDAGPELEPEPGPNAGVDSGAAAEPDSETESDSESANSRDFEVGSDSAPGDGANGGADGESGDSGDCDGVVGPGVGSVPLVDPDFGAGVDTYFADHPPGTKGRPRSGDRSHRRGPLQPARGTTSVVVVATLEQVASMTGMASTDTNVQMSVRAAIEQCDARNLFFQVLGFKHESLFLGRSNRRGSMAQYLALLGEEGMSSAPSSSAPAARCHVHHLVNWAAGGGTDLPNLTLVDPATHGRVDDARRDPDKWWSRAGVGPDEPRVVWIPPESMDPQRTPGENRHPAGWDNPGRRLRREAKNKREKEAQERRARERRKNQGQGDDREHGEGRA